MTLKCGPSDISVELQQYVQEHLASLLQSPMDQGTCKKCIRIPDTTFCVLITHETSDFASNLMHNELTYLEKLRALGFPVVETAGSVFPVQKINSMARYGLVERYIDNGVFIEAKTPSPLKFQIISALSGSRIAAKEAWFLQKEKLEVKIQQSLEHSNLNDIKSSAKRLSNHFKSILDKFEETHFEIADLQGIITQTGDFFIIDPLDVVKVDNGYNVVESITEPAKNADVDFVRFLKSTKSWLKTGMAICCNIIKAETLNELVSQLKESTCSNIKSPTASSAPLRVRQLLFREKDAPFTAPKRKPKESPLKLEMDLRGKKL